MSWFQRDDGGEPWRKLVKDHKPIKAVDEDSGELIDIKPEQDTPNDIDGLLIKFDYCDASGQETTRVVLCYKTWADAGVAYVQGYCLLRRKLRTFRIDRIAHLSEVKTSKKIDNVQTYFGHFADEPPATPYRPPTAKPAWRAPTRDELEAQAREWQLRHQARRVCIDGLRVLAYMALSGNGWTEPDRSIEESYIEARIAAAGMARNPDLTDAMMDVGAGLAVPFSSFLTAVKKVAADKGHFALVQECVEDIVAADGEGNPVREEAYHRLKAEGAAAVGRSH